MVLENVWEYRDLILLLISLILAAIANYFRRKAGLYESYQKASVATREFIDAVRMSLEDMIITSGELDEMKEKSELMAAAIREFLDALRGGNLTDDEIERQIQVIQSLGVSRKKT